MHSVILKNDAVGDLVPSLPAINNIIYSKDNKKVTIFLSERSKKFNFLVDAPNVEVKIINYNLSFFEKISLFVYIFRNKIDNIYILSPKNFYFYLPVFFRKIKFFALCVNNINNYKRPNSFLRKFLFKYVINERHKTFKRESTKSIQNRLTASDSLIHKDKNYKIHLKNSNKLFKYLPDKYLYFHYKKKRFESLNWRLNELNLLLKEFTKYYENIVFTKDNLKDENSSIFKNIYNSYDFKTDKFVNRKKNIIFLDNIEGIDLFNVIGHSSKVVAFHGMMTGIASLFKKPVLDLFHIDVLIENMDWESYRRTRNFFYEFKPVYKNYDFIIPQKNFIKTLKKMKFSLKGNS